MSQTTAERLATLEAEIATLKAAAATESQPAPAPLAAPTPYVDPATTLRAIPPRHLVAPSDAEMRALYAIAARAHIHLVRLPDSQEHSDGPFEEFRNAFLAIGLLGRTPQLDTSHSVSWWSDYARYDADGATLRSFGPNAFTLAALAHGDIAYRAWTVSSPVEFGLTWSNAGRPAGDAWRRVIASGRIPAPAEPTREPRDVRGSVERYGVAV